MTAADLLFSYHAPNERTTPKYEAIRAAEKVLQDVFTVMSAGIAVHYGMVNGTIVALYALVPPGMATPLIVVDGVKQHRDSQVQLELDEYLFALGQQARASIALARNAANEAIATRQDVPRLLAMARTEVQKARWALCGIVAIVDAATHPVAPVVVP